MHTKSGYNWNRKAHCLRTTHVVMNGPRHKDVVKWSIEIDHRERKQGLLSEMHFIFKAKPEI